MPDPCPETFRGAPAGSPILEAALDVEPLADPRQQTRIGDDGLPERSVAGRENDGEDGGLGDTEVLSSRSPTRNCWRCWHYRQQHDVEHIALHEEEPLFWTYNDELDIALYLYPGDRISDLPIRLATAT